MKSFALIKILRGTFLCIVIFSCSVCFLYFCLETLQLLHKPNQRNEFAAKEFSLKHDPLCQSVLNASSTENSTINDRLPDSTSDEEALNITNKGCSEIVKQYSFAIGSNLVTIEEQDNPIAFSVLVHVNAHQVISLLSAIYRLHNAYCVHVDAKSPKAMYSALQNVAKCFPNMVLATKREDVLYASISRLQADLNCMDDLLQSSIKWKYLINLCGQDFPLKTNFEIVQILNTLNESNQICGSATPSKQEEHRTKYIFKAKNVTTEDGGIELALQQTRELKSPPPFNMTVKKNLAYNIFTRSFLHWVLYESEKAKALLEWSRDTYSPDEHYWLMLDTLQEAPGKTGRISFGSFSHYVVWKSSGHKCEGEFRHFNCVFGRGDVKKMFRKKLFANKFDITFDSIPTICLRKYLDNKTHASEGLGRKN